MTITVNENDFAYANVLIERARVLSNTLVNTYFDQEVLSSADLWKVSGYFYDDAKILAETILSIATDVERLLNSARENNDSETELRPVS